MSPNTFPLVETRVSEKEEIRDWDSNHFCRPKKFLFLNLGPLVTNLGMVFSGHLTGLPLVKPLWWSCWLLYLVKVTHTNWACSVPRNAHQLQLNGTPNWQLQSRASVYLLTPPSLISASVLFLWVHSLFLFSNHFFKSAPHGYNAFNFTSMDLHWSQCPTTLNIYDPHFQHTSRLYYCGRCWPAEWG